LIKRIHWIRGISLWGSVNRIDISTIVLTTPVREGNLALRKYLIIKANLFNHFQNQGSDFGLY
jgi:hypothetical protein